MPRCPDCNKFVSLDSDVEPEVNDVSIDENGAITAEVRITNNCADCGSELTEANFSLEGQVQIEGHSGEGHELEAEDGGAERKQKSGYADKKTGKWVNAFGRYAKTFYGVSLTVQVDCSCGELSESVVLEDEIQASGMDSLV